MNKRPKIESKFPYLKKDFLERMKTKLIKNYIMCEDYLGEVGITLVWVQPTIIVLD